MSEFLMHISSPVPFRIIKNWAKVNPLIINYHVVSDQRLPHIINLYNYRSIAQFNKDLDFLTRNFNPISLIDFLKHLHHNTTLPEKSFLLTFDDGFKEIYDVAAPILIRKNLSATIFLTSNFIDNRQLGFDNKKSLLVDYLMQNKNENLHSKIMSIPGLFHKGKTNLPDTILNISYADRMLIDKIALELNYNFDDYLITQKPYLTSEQVHDLIKKGFTFGAHSLDHPKFSEITLEEQLNQAISSIRNINDWFSVPYKVFAFPYYDRKVSLGFFKIMSSHVEATFGTHGLLLDQVRNNFQRISVEKYNMSAETVIKFHFIRKFIYQSLGRDIIRRD